MPALWSAQVWIAFPGKRSQSQTFPKVLKRAKWTGIATIAQCNSKLSCKSCETHHLRLAHTYSTLHTSALLAGRPTFLAKHFSVCLSSTHKLIASCERSQNSSAITLLIDNRKRKVGDCAMSLSWILKNHTNTKLNSTDLWTGHPSSSAKCGCLIPKS